MTTAAMTSEYAQSPVAAERRPVDLGLRIAGGVGAVLAALVTGVLELLVAFLRVGGVLFGLALAWFVLMVIAASPTEEGDLLLTGSWVGLLMLLGGSVTFAVVAFRMIMQGPRGPRS